MASKANSVRAVVFAILGAVAVGAGGAWALAFTGQAPDQGTKTEQTGTTYQVQPVAFSDARNVNVSLRTGVAGDVNLSASGLVTRFDCAPSDEWNDWESPVAIDGKDRLLLATDTPFHRDLTWGERGDDVTALQELLKAEGQNLQVTGIFDAQTRTAMSELKKAKGISETQGYARGAFLRADFVWVAKTPALIADCKVTLGARHEGTAPIATTVAPIASAEIPQIENLLDGDRHLRFDQDTIDFPIGRTTDPQILEQILDFESVQWRLHMAEPAEDPTKPQTVDAIYELKEPKTAAAIPPMAIGNLSAGAGCVSDGTKTYSVEILSSTLGLTYVEFLNDDMPAEVLLRAPGDIACN